MRMRYCRVGMQIKTILTSSVVLVSLALFCQPSRSVGLTAPTPAVSTIVLPGEYRENRFNLRSTLDLKPGLIWSTSTGLVGTRYGQASSLGAQSIHFMSGPSFQLGRLGLTLPLSSGRELTSLNNLTSWSGGAPQMSLALTPKDQVRLEARVNSRRDPQTVRTRRSVALSWRHVFSERWAIQTGLREVRDVEPSGYQQLNNEAFGILSATNSSGRRWNIQASISEYTTQSLLGSGASNDKGVMWSFEARHEVAGRRWLSGSISAQQSYGTTTTTPLPSRFVGLRLQRDF